VAIAVAALGALGASVLLGRNRMPVGEAEPAVA
jgi:hypothetical protein